MSYKFKNPIRLIELFAGYGSQALALKYLGVPMEHWFVCEFDKYAMQSYNEIHGTNFEVSDVKNVHADDINITDTQNYKYLMTYSFPCTDLSVARKRKGMQRERVVLHQVCCGKLREYLLNVKNFHSIY